MSTFALTICGKETAIDQFLEELQVQIPHKTWWSKFLCGRKDIKIETIRTCSQDEILHIMQATTLPVQVGVA